jgi:ABC-type antimicrobial peptide transport system permease subunit
VHTRGDPGTLLRDVRAAASEPGVIPDVSLLKSAMDRRIGEVQTAAGIVDVLGATATLLAAFGIFGLVTFAVVQRTREIGLRLALGARPSHIMGTLVTQYVAALAAGGAAGAALAAACARAINHEFFGLKSFDPITYAVAVAIFASIALAAVALPARRALRIDPASALRWE